MGVLSRRELLQTAAHQLIKSNTDALEHLENLANLVGPASQYGFVRKRTPAFREPVSDKDPIGVYQPDALLRYRITEENPDLVQVVIDPIVHLPRRPLAHGRIYIPRENLRPLQPEETRPISPDIPVSQKVIEIKLAVPQTLTAYEGDRIFLETLISAGMENTTPQGEDFFILWSLTARYMQGPDFDLPGVPWPMYFTPLGHAIHGAYWRKNYGRPGSHGCINVPVEEAEILRRWAGPRGVRVIIHE